MKLKKLILIVILLNLVACSKTTKIEENITSNKEVYDENIRKETENNTTKNKKSNLKFEICDETFKYKQGDILYYKLSNEYDINGNQRIMDFFNSNNALNKLKKFNKDLKLTFDYNEIHSQPLVYKGYFQYDKKFSIFGIINEQIQKQNQLKPQPVAYTVEENKNDSYETKLKTLFIGKTFYSELNNLIEEGKNFSEEDFIVNNSEQVINVILGHSYKDIYKIGDELELFLHEKPLKCKVIGFLKKDVERFAYAQNKTLNETIVVPFYDINYFPTDNIDEFYQKLYYLQKNEGNIKLKENETNHIIENIQNIENIYYNYLERVENLAKENGLLFSIPICPVKI